MTDIPAFPAWNREADEGARPPAGFELARGRLRSALSDSGLPADAILAALMVEAVPLLVGFYGTEHASAMLAQLARDLRAGSGLAAAH